ncbi:MAG TPA: type VI secretion system tube protein Hcp [Paludibaculum sp.]|jgi:type VI secretion system secreted protein Hcp
MAAVDYFLKIDGIPGESQDHKHKDEIQIESFTWGATQGGGFSYGGGGGAGKVQMQDFHFTMKINKATPKLFLACANGEHIKSAVLTCRKAGKEQQEFLTVKLTDVLVSSYQSGGSGGSDVVPMEQISFNFAKVEFEYKEQKPDGTLAGGIKANYDLKQSKSH